MSWESECGRKVRHLSRAAAKKAAKHHPGEHLTPYQCSYCGQWHLGHYSPQTRAASRARRTSILD